MKKVLFGASLAMLVVGCAENEFDSLNAQKEAAGITFEAGLAEASTRGDLAYDADTQAHKFFWYAEKDTISIWSTNTKKNGTAFGGSDFATANVVDYKATQSKANGVFTAKSPADILDFTYSTADNGYGDLTDAQKEAKKSKFVAIYKGDATITTTYSGNKFTFSGLPTLKDQPQNTVDGQDVTKKLFMYSVTSAIKENAYDAVGEKIGLEFVRPYTALVFSIKGVNAYTDDFGKLDSIKVEMKGYKPAGGAAGAIPASHLDYGTSAKYELNLANQANNKLVASADKSSKLKVIFNGSTGIKWNDAYNAYMAINNVNRVDSGFTAAKPESYDVTYSFKKITFKKTYTTANNWVATGGNEFYRVRDLDISSYNYLVTNLTTANDRTLIVNKGTFSAIFNEAGNKVKWEGAEIAPTEFNKVVVKVAMSDTEMTKLKQFTNVKDIELTEVTSIAKNQFTDISQVPFESIVMPKVTSIDADAFVDQTALVTLTLSAYAFDNADVNAKFFNATTSGKLKNLDLCGVADMKPQFGSEAKLSFKGYSVLETVKVNNLKLVSNAFAECKNLKTIDGTVDISNATAAFAMEDSTVTTGGQNANNALKKIKIAGTTIPEAAFKNCVALTEITLNGNQVAPTSVGTSAFENCLALTTMNLENATAIGDSAFVNCKNFEFSAKNNKIMKVGAATIKTKAFKGTKLYMVNFTNATSIEDAILAGVGSLKQIKFTKAFTVDKTSATAWDAYLFGTTTNSVELFVAPTQEYISGTSLELPYKYNSTNGTFRTVQYPFKSITKE